MTYARLLHLAASTGVTCAAASHLAELVRAHLRVAAAQPFGHRIICVQRNWAIGFAEPAVATTASQTCVVRP